MFRYTCNFDRENPFLSSTVWHRGTQLLAINSCDHRDRPTLRIPNDVIWYGIRFYFPMALHTSVLLGLQ